MKTSVIRRQWRSLTEWLPVWRQNMGCYWSHESSRHTRLPQDVYPKDSYAQSFLRNWNVMCWILSRSDFTFASPFLLLFSSISFIFSSALFGRPCGSPDLWEKRVPFQPVNWFAGVVKDTLHTCDRWYESCNTVTQLKMDTRDYFNDYISCV